MSCYNIVKAKESIAVSGTDDLVQSHFLLHHLTPSPPVSEFGGQQLLKITALPSMSETDNCWKSWRTVTVSSLPVCLASALPSLQLNWFGVIGAEDWPWRFFFFFNFARFGNNVDDTYSPFCGTCSQSSCWKICWVDSQWNFECFLLFFYFFDWTSESWEKRGNRVMMAMLIDHHARIISPKKGSHRLKKKHFYWLD